MRYPKKVKSVVKKTLELWKQHKLTPERVIAAILQRKHIQSLLRRNDTDYITSLDVCKSLRKALSHMKYSERYSGLRRGIIAAALSYASKRAVQRLLRIGRKVVDAAKRSGFPQRNSRKYSFKSKILRKRRSGKVLHYVEKWIVDHATPSSNINNVVRVKEGGDWINHIIHWRTETIDAMFQRCKLSVLAKFGVAISKSFFYNHIPGYVRLKKKQEGLCPYHYTGISLQKEFQRKRTKWHQDCHCQCAFCSTEGCNHGKDPTNGSCFALSCANCIDEICPLEWSDMETTWKRPIQCTRVGGGKYWTDEVHHGTRKDFMRLMSSEMAAFTIHNDHTIYHKEQIRMLQENLTEGEIIVQSDFIQNIVHSRGRETTQTYYGKRQSQFLSFVIWYYEANGTEQVHLHKIFVDYLSSYLKHNSMFFQKCLLHLLVYLQDVALVDFHKVWLLSDGGKGHFKSRFSFFFASTLPEQLGVTAHWVYAPSHHGKGECDSHGAVVKRKIKAFILDDQNHVDDEHEAVHFIRHHVANSFAFVMDITDEDYEQDSSQVKGSSKAYEYRFAGEEGEVLLRTYPCFCPSCMREEYHLCTNKVNVGAFTKQTMKKKDIRVPVARYQSDTIVQFEDSDEQYEVEQIRGKRYIEGKCQYQIKWKSLDEVTWVEADKLKCYDLVEDYEMDL